MHAQEHILFEQILSYQFIKEKEDVCAWYGVNEEWTAKKEVKK